MVVDDRTTTMIHYDEEVGRMEYSRCSLINEDHVALLLGGKGRGEDNTEFCVFYSHGEINGPG